MKLQTILDTERLRSLRLTQNLSQRALAKHLGTTSIVIRGLEEGRNHNDLSLRFVADLATALGVEPAALYPRAESATSESPNQDARKVGAAFASYRVGLSRNRMAAALGWKLDRFAAAVGELNNLLAGAGMRVEAGSAGWKLQPDLTTLSWQDELRLETARHTERGLRLREAEILRDALDAPLDGKWEQHIGNADRVALGGLLKSGLAKRGEQGIVPSESVRVSLRVTGDRIADPE